MIWLDFVLAMCVTLLLLIALCAVVLLVIELIEMRRDRKTDEAAYEKRDVWDDLL